MKNKLYNKILFSIDKEVRNIIYEQFNIGNIDLNAAKKHGNNIFNKSNLIDPYEIYNKIIYGNDVNENEILYLNDYKPTVIVKYRNELRSIIEFYSENYKTSSLNWLDVS